jgi:spermidine synthase
LLQQCCSASFRQISRRTQNINIEISFQNMIALSKTMQLPAFNYRVGLMVVFIASGFSGLIYQSIWSHYLGQMLGHAAYAQALVLCIFMGGMAIGSWWISRVTHKIRDLIVWYAIIEAVIGVFGLIFHILFTNVLKLGYEVWFPAIGDPFWISVSRWALAAAIILPQTILLGMTFPLMSGGLIRYLPKENGATLGGLYFTNSIGAALGALAAVFFLLPNWGLPGAMTIAGFLNLGVAIASAGLAWAMRESKPTGTEASTYPSVEKSVRSSLERNSILPLVLGATALSSAASFAYEIVWVRMLGMAVGNTMHAFELMLASFIGGLAFGGLWIRNHANTTSNPLVLAGWMQVAMGVAALFSLFVYANAFAWVGWLMTALSPTLAGYQLYNLGTAGLAMAIMMPAAFFAGTTLPLFTVALIKAGEGESSIGRVYAFNTFGSILGVFAAIHWLIPALGLKLALILAATVDILIGLFLLRRFAARTADLVKFGVAGVSVAVVLVVASRIQFDPLMLASGVFRSGKSMLDTTVQVPYYKDGKTASVSVLVTPSVGQVSIATNGKVDASLLVGPKGTVSVDEPTMIMAAALPLGMHSNPEKVGIIGFGSGLTTHTALGDSRVKLVETVEIEQAMVDGARSFGHRVERAYTDPRSVIVIDDAKAFFAGQQRKYDVIVSEPSNPWISGIGALFSTEFYQYVGNHLNEDGIFVQWIQLYEINEGLVSTVIRGLTSSFSDYEAWLTNASDLLIIAKPKGQLNSLDWSMVSPFIKTELARIDIRSEEQLKFRKIANAALLRSYSKIDTSFPANSVYFPVLGLNAPQARYMRAGESTLSSLPITGGLLLDALEIRSPMKPDSTVSLLDIFRADQLTSQARALNGFLQKGPSATTFSKSVLEYDLSSAQRLRALMPACIDPRSGVVSDEFAELLAVFSELTLPFLSPQEMSQTWQTAAWKGCGAIPTDLQFLLNFHHVLGQRDWPAVLKQGESWFALPRAQSLSLHFDAVVLYGMQLAHLKAKDGKAMLAADAQWGGKVSWPRSLAGQRALLTELGKDLSR